MVEEKVGIETGGRDSHRQRLRHAPKTVTGVCQDYGSEVNLCIRRRPSPHGPTKLSYKMRDPGFRRIDASQPIQNLQHHTNRGNNPPV